MTLSRRRVVLCSVALALLLGGCAAAEEADVRDTATGAEEDGSPTGSAAAAAEQECSPVNPELEAEADTTIELQLADFAFEPSDLSADAGVITFATTNVGEETHELAFLPGGGEVPFTDEGEPDEEALEAAGAFELEAYGPGQDCNATYDLEPDTYTLFCIVESPDGETHYEKGMRGTLTVD